jgi:hypothetical protein
MQDITNLPTSGVAPEKNRGKSGLSNLKYVTKHINKYEFLFSNINKDTKKKITENWMIAREKVGEKNNHISIAPECLK